MRILIKNGTIVNEGLSYKGSLLINGNIIEKILSEKDYTQKSGYEDALVALTGPDSDEKLRIIDAEGLHILPGVIDDQVHFREPGNTAKATVESESRAAILGGVTSFMDMPNNNPPTVTLEALEEKYRNASANSYANYSFYLGATNNNIDEIKNCFNPTIKTIFPDYFEKGKCFFETIEFERKATTLANELTNENLLQMFKTPSTSYIEEYLRHAILSQFNLKKLLQQASKEEKDLVQQELLQSTTLSDKAIAILFKDANLDDLLYLAKGVLQSLTSPKKIINIKDCCQKHEINLNSKNSSKLFLPNGDEIPPLPENRQEKKLIRFQKKYEFLYKNATDLEYVEGCTEILGDLLIAQIYDYANIEISKCLFNTLLISRGILPPVLNFNKNNQELLKDFIKGINNRSQSAIPKVLEEVITQTEQLKHKKYNKPTII